jgi:hypothetical protein
MLGKWPGIQTRRNKPMLLMYFLLCPNLEVTFITLKLTYVVQGKKYNDGKCNSAVL